MSYSLCGKPKKILAVVSVVLVVIQVFAEPLLGFDTFWHSATTSAATREFSFSDDAINIVQFGNFSGPDFFGPLYDTVLGERLEKVQSILRGEDKLQFDKLQDYDTARAHANIRKSAIFMHFDNLDGKLNSNARFNYLFATLLANTDRTICNFYLDRSQNDGIRKMGILMTLGVSLHTVQDFYSHSNWVHQDFEKNFGLAPSKTPWGKLRGPTWYEVIAKSPDPSKWPIRIASGIYPAPKNATKDALGTPMNHTFFNHDNSQLFYEGASQVDYHDFGPVSATQSPQEHQLYACNTAAIASIEWIRKLEDDPTTKTAIDFAKTWKLKDYNPAMLDHLTQSLAATLFFSCAASKWDGDHPPRARASECKGIGIISSGSAAAGASAGAMLLPGPFIPFGLSFLNEFWAMHTKFDILKQLTYGFGNQVSGQYIFSSGS